MPVETTKIEYRDQLVRDSIFHYDSVFVKQQADTVFFERYKYLYRDKIIRDSIFKTDTIHVPYPVEVVKQVKNTTNRLAKFPSMVRANCPCIGLAYYRVFCAEIEKKTTILRFIPPANRKSRF
jgi:hypothetical protein